MKRLFHYLNKYKYQSILGPLFKLFETVFELLVPFVVAKIIDVGIKNADVDYVVKYSLLLCLMAAVGLAFSLTAQFFAAKASVGCAESIRLDIFKKINSLSHSQIDKIGTATLITRITGDVNLVQTGINLVLRLMLRSPFVVFGAMFMAFLIDSTKAIIFLGVIIVLFLVVSQISNFTIPMYKKAQIKVDSILRETKESLSGAKVIRAFGIEDIAENEFKEENQDLNILQRASGAVASLMNPITYFLVNLGIICLIYSGALDIDSGYLSQGALVALYNYMTQILVELIKFANLIITCNKSVASLSRINMILDIEEVENNGNNELGVVNEIAFNNISFHYDNVEKNAIENITFKANKGEFIGVIGGTGSGKTTLINLITGSYIATQGELIINGKPITEFSPSSLADCIGLVPQKAVLFTGTIRDNILWGNSGANEADILNALKNAQGMNIIESKSEGLDAFVEQNGANFSGGQRQRLTIARALVKNPQILILDDSGSALDYATDSMLRKAIRDNYKDSIVFIVSQRASSIIDCDKIIVLEDGAVTGIGSHSELLKSNEEYREIYNTQYKGEGA